MIVAVFRHATTPPPRATRTRCVLTVRRHLRKGRHSLSTDEIERRRLVCRKGDMLEVVERAKTIELP